MTISGDHLISVKKVKRSASLGVLLLLWEAGRCGRLNVTIDISFRSVDRRNVQDGYERLG